MFVCEIVGLVYGVDKRDVLSCSSDMQACVCYLVCYELICQDIQDHMQAYMLSCCILDSMQACKSNILACMCLFLFDRDMQDSI